MYNRVMYKKIKTDKECLMENGTIFNPIATLADEYGGRVQVDIDDHCYVLKIRLDHGKYRMTPYIFREVFDVLTSLEPPK